MFRIGWYCASKAKHRNCDWRSPSIYQANGSPSCMRPVSEIKNLKPVKEWGVIPVIGCLSSMCKAQRQSKNWQKKKGGSHALECVHMCVHWSSKTSSVFHRSIWHTLLPSLCKTWHKKVYNKILKDILSFMKDAGIQIIAIWRLEMPSHLLIKEKKAHIHTGLLWLCLCAPGIYSRT